MKSLRKIAELADKFEYRLSRRAQELDAAIPLEAPQVSQAGTTELFFDSEDNQRKFATAIQKPEGPVYNALLKAFNSTGKASFSLKMNAAPNKGANWILSVSPSNATASVSAALDLEYKKIMGGQSMGVRVKMADSKAKAGSGSGSLDVGELDLS